MALAKAVQGATRPSQRITWSDADGDALDLTDATLTGRIRDAVTGAARDVAGTLTVTDAAAGEFTWGYAPADVAQSGKFVVQFTAEFQDDPTPAKTFRQEWTVEASI